MPREKSPVTSQSQIRMTWRGRREAEAELETPTSLEWRWEASGSFEWESAQGVLLEADNLDALKFLQNRYLHQVQLIYLDPPYNLGRQFIYRDPACRDEWLSMMFPRLTLAKNLLCDRGTMMVSVDDETVHLLRILLDEIFGPENHVATFTWETKRAARGRPPQSMVMSNHEYVVCYARDASQVRLKGLPRELSGFSNPDDDPRGPWRSESMKATGSRENRFSFSDPQTGFEFGGSWAFSQETIQSMIQDDLILFPKTREGVPRQKKHFNAYLNTTKAGITSLGWHSTERATKELQELFDGERVFPFPKPLSLMRYLLNQALQDGDLVLDLFAGSGSTGHAAWLESLDRSISLRFILIQRPESFDPTSDLNQGAARLCNRERLPFKISSITKERLRRASLQLECLLPFGLRCFMQSAEVASDQPEAKLMRLLLESKLDLTARLEELTSERELFYLTNSEIYLFAADVLDLQSVSAIKKHMSDRQLLKSRLILFEHAAENIHALFRSEEKHSQVSVEMI